MPKKHKLMLIKYYMKLKQLEKLNYGDGVLLPIGSMVLKTLFLTLPKTPPKLPEQKPKTSQEQLKMLKTY